MTAPLKVGLTGGVGSGKTTVSDMFAALGVPVIDADEISRAATRRDGPAFAAVAELFGAGMIGSDGELRRDAIRAAVFADQALRRRLEAIVHPAVRDEILRRVAVLDEPYCIVSIPLLVETGGTIPVDRVLVVDCPEERQIQRVMQRDSVPRAGVEAMLCSQAARGERLARADDVIDNDGDFDVLRTRVRELHDRYRSLAARGVATPA